MNFPLRTVTFPLECINYNNTPSVYDSNGAHSRTSPLCQYYETKVVVLLEPVDPQSVRPIYDSYTAEVFYYIRTTSPLAETSATFEYAARQDDTPGKASGTVHLDITHAGYPDNWRLITAVKNAPVNFNSVGSSTNGNYQLQLTRPGDVGEVNSLASVIMTHFEGVTAVGHPVSEPRYSEFFFFNIPSVYVHRGGAFYNDEQSASSRINFFVKKSDAELATPDGWVYDNNIRAFAKVDGEWRPCPILQEGSIIR